MSLSFEESLKLNSENNVATTSEVATIANIDTVNTVDASIMTLDESSEVAAYIDNGGDWIQHPDYDVYTFLEDNNISSVDSKKEIKLNQNQVNITQEENSQYIPFEIPRFYDGFDLSSTVISIHYETSNNYHGVSKPVNVTYNNESIKFGWLVDAGVTQVAGGVKFEIHANGSIVNSAGEAKAYTWKTKYNDSLNVLESICGSDCDGSISINDTWVQEIVTSVAENVANKIADAQVGEQVANAQQAAAEAKIHAENATDAASTVVESALENYSTTAEMETYVGQQIASADIEGKLTEYVKISEVKTLVGDIGEYESVVDYVDTAIQNVDVSEELAEYVKNSTLTDNYYTKSDSDAKLAATLTEKNYATQQDVVDAIAGADLDNYYKKDETYSKEEINDALSNVQVDLTDYATETYVDTKTSTLSTSIETNAAGISSLNKSVEDINQTIESIDTSPRTTYKATYGDVELDDGTTAEYMFTLWKNEGDGDEVQDRFQIMGGGGSSGSSVVLRIAYLEGYTTPIVATADDKAVIKYEFSGEDSAGDTNLDGVASWKVGNRVVATEDVVTGECEFDLTDYVSWR